MAYIEIKKHGKLIKRRPVDDRQARKGCRIRLGGQHVQLKLGQSKVVGDYQLTLFEGDMPDSEELAVDGLSECPDEMVTKTSDPLPPTKKRNRPSHVPTIEGYEIVGRIGRGGMGTVWKAVQLSTKRPVALKFLARHRFSSKKAKARFEREVALAARLTHPNIARVYASGLHHGVYYYAMELVEGQHLDQYARTHQLSDRDILQLMYHICDAMAHAHGQGIVHRDLKPSNILVSADGQPHIVDFGLAKTSTKDDSDLTISIEGEIAGTIAYMAPEQAMGQQEKITERTDVYGLGVILYQLLTGHLPHAMGRGRYDILKRIVEEDVTEPSHFNEAIDRELESIILTALEKLPEDRYPSARVLAQDIDNYLKGEPLYARSLSSVYRLKKRLSQKMSKHRMLAIGTLLGCLLMGIVLVIVQYRTNDKSSIPTGRIAAEMNSVQVPLASEREPLDEQSGASTPPGISTTADMQIVPRSMHRTLPTPPDASRVRNGTSDQDKRRVEAIVNRLMTSRKTPDIRRVFDESLARQGYVFARVNPQNPKQALVHDRDEIMASMSSNGHPDDRFSFEIISSDVKRPFAYVLVRDAHVGHGSEDIIEFLMRVNGQWKVIATCVAEPIRRVLFNQSGVQPASAQEHTAQADIRKVVDQINTAWQSQNGWQQFQEQFLHDNCIVAYEDDAQTGIMILDKSTCISLLYKVKTSDPTYRRQVHIDNIVTYGPLAVVLGTTTVFSKDGQQQEQFVDFFALGSKGWQCYYSTAADSLRALWPFMVSTTEHQQETSNTYFQSYAQKYPLHAAVRDGDMKKLRTLLDQGVALDQLDLRKWSALHWAVYTGRADIAQELVNRGVRLKSTLAGDILKHSIGVQASINGNKQLAGIVFVYADWHEIYLAVYNEDLVRVRELLEQDPNLAHMEPQYGPITVLHEAAAIGSKEAVSLLIEYGADVNVQIKWGYTPLLSAANWGQKEMVDYLISLGAHKDMCSAAALGDIESVRAFVQQDPNAVNAEHPKISPLDWAALGGYADVAKLLIEYGADVNDHSCLSYTVRYNHVDTAEVLLEHGAANALDDKEKSLQLATAAYNGCVNMVRLLHSYGFNTKAKHPTGMSPLHLATFSGDVSTVDFILNNIRDDINNQNKQGHSSLDIAKQMGYDPVVKLFLAYAARKEQGLQETRTGIIYGIGVGIEIHAQGIIIKTVIDGAPSQNAGLEPGEIITKINDQIAQGMPLTQAISLIKGPSGTSVRLGLLSTNGTIRTVDVYRGPVVLSGVKHDIPEADIGHLTIDRFNAQTLAAVQEALASFKDQGVQHLILDLRNNNGGVYTNVVQVTELFVGRGRIMWKTQRVGQNRKQAVWTQQTKTCLLPLVVLVGPQTSGGGELLASALQTGEGAKLIGTKTFGKGTSSVYKQQSNGQSIKVPHTYLFTAQNQAIQDRGITPDTPCDPNQALELAIETFKQKL